MPFQVPGVFSPSGEAIAERNRLLRAAREASRAEDPLSGILGLTGSGLAGLGGALGLLSLIPGVGIPAAIGAGVAGAGSLASGAGAGVQAAQQDRKQNLRIPGQTVLPRQKPEQTRPRTQGQPSVSSGPNLGDALSAAGGVVSSVPGILSSIRSFSPPRQEQDISRLARMLAEREQAVPFRTRLGRIF